MSIAAKLVPVSPLKTGMTGIDSVRKDVVIVKTDHFYDVGRRAAVITIGLDSFDDLAKAMMKADPKSAAKAFGKALQLTDLA